MTIVSSGELSLLSAGVPGNGIIVQSGGTLDVLSGAIAGGVVVEGGGMLWATAGTLSGAVLSSGAMESLSGGALAVGGTISAGAAIIISPGAAASGGIIGGTATLMPDGTLTAPLVIDGGVLTMSGGDLSGGTIGSGGFLTVSNGQISGEVVSGGTELLSSFGAEIGIELGGTIIAGGTQTIDTGVAANTVIASGGIQYVHDHQVYQITVENGGLQSIGAGAEVIFENISAGGTVIDDGSLLLFAGELVAGRLVGDGLVIDDGPGTLTLGTGNLASDVAGPGFTGMIQIDGAGLALAGPCAAGNAVIDFAADAPGTLVIDGPVMPANVISGLIAQDAIALEGLAWSSAASVSVAGSLVSVVANGTTFGLTIAGAAGDGIFHLAQAADGSILLTDTLTDSIVSGGVTAVISSGRHASNFTALSGGTVDVLAGGTLVSGGFLSGGVAVIAGVDSAGDIGQHASATVQASGSGVRETIEGTLTVGSGGTILGDTVDGGSVAVLAGAVASGTVLSVGTLVVTGGIAAATTIASGGFLLLSAGSTVGDVVNGGTVVVHNNGFLPGSPIASAGTILAGGTQALLALGVASGTTVSSGGLQWVDGGTASGAVVSSGGVQLVAAGALAVDDTLLGGGTVEAAGTLLFSEAPGAMVTLGGRLIGSGGIWQDGSGTLVLGAAVTSVYAVSGFTGPITLVGGTLLLASGGAAGSGPIGFAAGGSATLAIAGTAMPVNVISGFNAGDAIDLAAIAYGSGDSVTAMGDAVTIAAGGADFVLDIEGAAAAGPFRLTAASDGSVVLGGARSVTTISGGATATLSGGVVAKNLVVTSGGLLDVLSGGVAVSAVVLAGGRALFSRGTGSASVLSSGAAVTVAGGLAVADVVSGGALELAENGGQLSATMLDGGSAAVLAGGTLLGGWAGNGGLVMVQGGSVAGVTIAAGGLLLLSAGVTSGDVVSGGVEAAVFPLSAGLLAGSLITAGGTQDLYAGSASGAFVGSGGVQDIAGGTAIATSLAAGGLQRVAAASTARGDLVAAGGTAIDDGTLWFGAGSVSVAGRITGSGAIVQAGGGTLVLAGSLASDSVDPGFTGAISLEAGTIELTGPGAAGSAAIAFAAGGGGTLRIDGAAMPVNVISGLAAGDVIDLPGIAFAGTARATLGAGNQLTVSGSGATATLALDPAQSLAGTYFALTRDAAGGILVSEAGAPCFCPGTRIRTPTGDRPIEEFAIGDQVVTVAGRHRPVRWLGHRRYAGRLLRGRTDLLPIRFVAGALGPGNPVRDLVVSPLHALLIEGVLVPAARLVNGVSVRQDVVDAVAYIHLELDSHDVIWAEGTPAETFFDDDSRALFENAADFLSRYPGAGRSGPRCAPLRDSGAQLAALCARIARRAGVPDPACPGTLRGTLDQATPAGVRGWAQSLSRPELAVCLDVLVDDRVIARTLADRLRADLFQAGIGSGRHGFDVALPRRLGRDVPHMIAVRRSADGMVLENSPWALDPVAPAAASGRPA